MLGKLFIGDTDNTKIQFFRYLFVGGVGFVSDTTVFVVLIRVFHIDYQLAGVVGFLTGLLLTYFLSVSWVFSQNRKYGNKLHEFGIFSGIGLVGLVLNAIFLWVFYKNLGLLDVMAKIISAGLVYIWNFSARKYILFNQTKPTGD